ncbi:TRAP transporter large permease [Evansella sp. LMS18]|jgi:tripartite ATP-independent transporter DctM subunit|uniref:TRAP transporter large permease n=1 Tax=Evansella sp. LMS18 TaxID=2924033 RepID=UPI0020D052A3|nr:TRAP transporter large permease [Evansella sp. LMS18]UTR12728.1 TRAP transporter large permease [Evansella sp. LMS18]
MTMLLMLAALIIGLIIGIPAVFSMGLATLLYFILERGLFDVPDFMIAQRTVFGLDKFALLAIPLFLLVGKVMNESGVTHRLFDFAKALVGHFRGGLGQVNILASVIFAGMSGSATADAAGLGAVEIKAMKDAKYPTKFACSITAASSLIGPVIPPSIPIVLYAIVAGVSVNQLLIAGIIPGILMALALSIFVAYQAIKYNYPTEAKASMRRIASTGKRAILPLMTPVILVGGILSGVFTATEAAAVGSLYAIILACIIYRSISLSHLYDICKRTMQDSAVIMIILAVSNIFAWILTRERVPLVFTDFITALTENYYLVMGLCLLFLLFLGMFLSSIVSITIATPVLIPLVMEVGGDPLHFGIIMILALMMGEVTPPFGMVLFAITRVGKIPFIDLVRGVVPYLIPIFILLVILIAFPQIVLFLPKLLM